MIFFHALSFFTLGFLCLTALISFVLNFYFRARAYNYYLTYVVSAILFVITVIIIQENYEEYNFEQKWITIIIYDILRVVIFYFHSLFIYKSMVIENKKLKKLSWLITIYTSIVFLRILMAFISPHFMDENPIYLEISRALVMTISLIIFYYLFKEFSNTYLRILFIASAILIFFVLLTILDALWNNHNSTLRGFMFFCMGVILENICFVSLFIFQIIKIEGDKKLIDILHQEQLSKVQLEMQQQTMEQIGRELHDNIGQKLTLASLYTQQLAFENKAPLIINTINNISGILNQSLIDLRQLSKSFTYDKIENNTLNELLAIECESFNELKQCKLSFEFNSDNIDLPYQTKIILLRVTQEFIQNSIKHAKCNNIFISLNKSDLYLYFSLQDDGIGFNAFHESSNGIGLSNIKKRILLIGGVYDISSNENGTKLTIEIAL